MTRSIPVIPALLVLAAGLLVLSFVLEDGPGATAAIAPTTAVTVTPEPATRSSAEAGRTLFAIKGCTACHRHDGLTADRLSHGGEVIPASGSFSAATGAPDLTNYEPDPAFLRMWLKDPKAVRPNTIMPNLGLREDEIEALIAFLQE